MIQPPRITECTRHFECEVVWTREWLNRIMVVGYVVTASVQPIAWTRKGYLIWDKAKPVAFCGAPYVDAFRGSRIETMAGRHAL